VCRLADSPRSLPLPLQEAALSVVAESYRLWLQHETRTDDITMVVLQFQGLEESAMPMSLPTPAGWVPPPFLSFLFSFFAALGVDTIVTQLA
jgi:hypothetical protein